MSHTTHPLILAHRGDSFRFAENTLPAFESALAVGADGFEIDVQFTKDKQIIVLHDETIDRVSDGFGFVEDYTYDELLAFNFAHYRPDLDPCHLPLLSEVLDFIVDTPHTINIELKDSIRPYPGLVEATVELVNSMGLNSQIIYSSFNHYSMVQLKAIQPDAVTALLYTQPLYEPWHYVATTGADAVHPHFGNLQIPGYMDAFRKLGKQVNVWTVDRPDDLQAMLDQQVDAIITNVPADAVELRSRGLSG